MCAIVLRKHPDCGVIKRGMARQSQIDSVFEHFWIEAPDGVIIDPANLSLPYPVPLEYNVVGVTTPQIQEDNNRLWAMVQDGTVFKKWDKESLKRLAKV